MKHLSETKEFKESGLLSQAKVIEDASYWKKKYKDCEKEKEQLLKEKAKNLETNPQMDSLKELAEKFESAFDREHQKNVAMASLLTDLGIDVTKIC